MNTKIYGLFLVLFAFYNIGFARKCYLYVDNLPFNANTTLIECDPYMAQATLLEHNRFYNVSNTATSTNYECIKVESNNTDGKWIYGGCIYHGLKYCDFPLRDPNLKLTCKQCNKDECNDGAFGISPSYFGIIFTATAATILSSRLL